eukprot:jgi/Botrbrau1/15671/Bobra.4_1s0053.2
MVDYQASLTVAPREQSRSSGSKYDFVKVKVWLGENQSHHYVLSRFLISRMLTVTKIPYIKAHFEDILFHIMRSRGFGDEYVQRYKMVSQFFQQRRPLIILICGLPCTGKSTVAQQLASRLNLPNVLQTDIICELLRSADGPLHVTPLWERSDMTPDQILPEFLRECNVVRRGLEGDLHKCIHDGKSIIVEGLHLDPGLYMSVFRMAGPPAVPPHEPSPCTQAPRQQSEEDVSLPSVGGRSKSWTGATSQRSGSPEDWGTGDVQGTVGRRTASFILTSQPGTQLMQPRLMPSPGFGALEGLQPSPPRHGPATPDVKQSAAPSSTQHPVRNSTAPGPIPLHADQLSASGAGAPAWQEAPATAVPVVTGRGPSLNGVAQPGAGPPNKGGGALEFEGRWGVRGSGSSTGDRGRGALGTGRDSGLGSLWRLPSWHLRLPTLSEGAGGSRPASPQGTQGAGPHPGGAPREDPAVDLAVPVPSKGSQAHGDLADGEGVGQRAEQGVARPSDEGSRFEARPGSGKAHAPLFPASNGRDAGRRSLERVDSGRGGGKGAASGGPVFVPIVLRMAPEDHETLVEEWYARLQGAGSISVASGGIGQVLARMRVLEGRLSAYEALGVPVVTLRLLDAQDGVDQLHDYLLQCIQMAMESSPQGA